jgi:hypothetical protein
MFRCITDAAARFVCLLIPTAGTSLLLLSGRVLAEEAALQKTAPKSLVVVRLTDQWFASRLGKEVDEVSPVNQVILDTHVVGTARTMGRPVVKLEEDSEQASFQIVFTGVTNSRTTGRHGPAILSSRSQTKFTATKQVIFVPGKGFEALPTQIAADTQTTTDDIRSTRGGWIGRLIVRRAWKKVAESKPLTTEIARQNAMARISASFDRRIDDSLANWNRAVDLRETLAMLRGRDGSPGYSCCSTSKYVEFALASDSAQSAAIRSTCPPSLDQLEGPIQIWMHRSLVPTQVAEGAARLQAAQSSLTEALSRVGRVVPVSFPWPLATPEAPGRTNSIAYQLVDDWTVVSLPASSSNSTPTTIATHPIPDLR